MMQSTVYLYYALRVVTTKENTSALPLTDAMRALSCQILRSTGSKKDRTNVALDQQNVTKKEKQKPAEVPLKSMSDSKLVTRQHFVMIQNKSVKYVQDYNVNQTTVRTRLINRLKK